MDIPATISTGTTFAQWIKNVSRDLEVMRTSTSHLSPSTLRDITFNEFENLAGQKRFPGPDAVVLGNYEEDVPVELDDDMVPAPVTTPSELREMELYNERKLRLQANPPQWGPLVTSHLAQVLYTSLASCHKLVHQATMTLWNKEINITLPSNQQ
eukprot:gene29107-biopygen32972